MYGTDKQLAWVETIIAGWQLQADQQTKMADARVACGDLPAAWSDMIKAVASEQMSRLRNAPKASDIIDNRHINVGSVIERTAISRYKQPQSL